MSGIRETPAPAFLDQRITAAAVAWCCPEGCAYLEDEREAECDAMTGCDGWLRERVRVMLEAADTVATP